MKSQNLRTLFITKEVPYPIIGGGSLRNWQNMNELKKLGQLAVFSASNWTPQYAKLPHIEVDHWLHCNVVSQRTKREQLSRSLWWLRPYGHPDVEWAYSNEAARQLDQFISKFAPDLVIIAEMWLYSYLKVVQRHPCHIILDQYNVEADLFKQKFATQTSLRSRLKSKLQGFQTYQVEKTFIDQADQVWVCSDNDTQLVEQLYGQGNKCVVIPNGVSLANYESVRQKTCDLPQKLTENPHTVLFLGQLSYPPNKVGGEWLIQEIYPKLREIYPDCRLLLVGRNPSPLMVEAGQKDPNIVVTGMVDSVLPYLASANVMLVPLKQGGGTRLKILEAFASGCPVVSTAKGAEGLNVTDGKELLIGNTAEEIVEKIDKLWNSPQLQQQLTQSALEMCQNNYSWEAVGTKIETAIAQLINDEKASA